MFVEPCCEDYDEPFRDEIRGRIDTLQSLVAHGALTLDGLHLVHEDLDEFLILDYLDPEDLVEMEWLHDQVLAEIEMRALDNERRPR